MKTSSMVRVGAAICAVAGTAISAHAADPIVFDSGYVCIVYWDATPGAGAWAPTRLGFSSGALAGLPQRWLAQPFTLSQRTNITQIDPEGFVPAGGESNNLNFIIWKRNPGNPAPVAADQVASGSTPFPAVLLDDPRYDPNNPNGNLAGVVAPIPCNVTLDAGNYYLTVYGDSPLTPGADANFAWFTNAQLDTTLTPPNTPIVISDANGVFTYRSASFPTPGFARYTASPIDRLLVEPSPVSYGPDPQSPDYLYSTAFQIRGIPVTGPSCYANCDNSTTVPFLNVNDFICFQTKFAAGDTYANCDNSTTAPVLNVNDFICFQTKFAAGCSAP